MKKIHFYYPTAKRLTGQELASKLILETLGDEYSFRKVKIPAFDRESNSIIYRISYLFKVAFLWLRFAKLIFVKKPIIYLNMGQGLMALLRDAVPMIVVMGFKRRASLIISLHGHIFTTWEEEMRSSLFKKILSKASVVTVLGEKQKERLIFLGISDNVVQVVNNTCEIKPVKKVPESEVIKLLYLSNLIHSKGYRVYLEALVKISKLIEEKNMEELKLEAVLCGQVTITSTSATSEKKLETEEWIQSKISEINSLGKIKVLWIQGAYGNEKEKLFRDADLFVFPTYYSIEAQPIVLIEAMASGCAIVTTDVGEIPSMVTKKCAVLIDGKPDVSKLAGEIVKLLCSQDSIKKMKIACLDRYESHFSCEIYKYEWKQIFQKGSQCQNQK